MTLPTKSVLAVATLALVATLAGCASGGRSSLSWDLGLSTSNDVQEEALQIFRQYRYEIERHEEPPSIYIITRWLPRYPFPDERARGIVEARSRFILEARPRSHSLGVDPNREDPYSVKLRAENEGRMRQTPEFTVLEPTQDFKEYADRLANDLKAVLEMGIRVWGVG